MWRYAGTSPSLVNLIGQDLDRYYEHEKYFSGPAIDLTTHVIRSERCEELAGAFAASEEPAQPEHGRCCIRKCFATRRDSH